MFRLLRPFFAYCTLLLILLLPQQTLAQIKQINIGVLAVWGKNSAHEMWQPTINYLNKRIPEYQFKLVPLSLAETKSFVQRNKIGFLITNPGNYITLEANYGISPIATLETIRQNKSSNKFGAVIFTHRDNTKINKLEDIKNKSFMGIKKQAFGGFQMAWLDFKKQDIDPFNDFLSLQFSGFPQDNVVFAVLNKKVDAGTVRTSTLERMAKNGFIDLNNIKILNQKFYKDFPYIVSTDLYPEWPIATLKNTPIQLSKSVSIALLKLSANDLASIKAKISGWTVALDYYKSRRLFKVLNIAPYYSKPLTFVQRHWGSLLFILLLLMQPLFYYIKKLRTEIQDDEDKLLVSETQWENALNFLDDPMYMVDLDDRIIRANKAFYKKIKTSPKKAVGRVVTNFTHPEGEKSPCKVCLARKKLQDTTITLEADDPTNKDAVPLEVSVKVIRDDKNNAIGIIQRMRDLTKTRKAEKNLRRSESLFKEILNATPEALLVSDSTGTITLVNSHFEAEFGYSRNEIIGQKVEILIAKKHQASHIRMRNNYLYNPYPRTLEEIPSLQAQHKDGHTFPVNISLNPFIIENEKLTIATIDNITERLIKENELKRLASFPECNPNPILEFDLNGFITYANPASVKWFPDIIESKDIHDLLSDIDMKNFNAKNNELVRNISINSSTFEQKIIFNSETQLFRTYIWDITTLRQLTNRMSYQASHDDLTKLFNRREFESRLSIAIENAQINNQSHSMCYMDLDQFKSVNDSCGHAAGDELLIQISSLINSSIRGNDTFARLGGDEFGLLLNSCNTDKAFEICEVIRRNVEQFRFSWDNKTFKVGISIGIVIINSDSQSIKEVQYAADTACYIAKEQGRNRVHIYFEDINAIAKHHNQTSWLNKINTALDEDRFILYFQKIENLNDKDDEHYEVLVRMKDSDGTTIPPNRFIPTAEKYNIMTSIDSWVIDKTLEIMQEEAYLDITFSINLSGQSLSDTYFMQKCMSKVKQSSINPSRICFEITETAMIENIGKAIESVEKLRDLGCSIALDDFGSGLSSFAYLKQLPIDYLKIDGSLIKDLDGDEVNITMVKSIIQIAESMGLKTIAEYVENEKTLKTLSGLKIDFVQGYGIAKPVPIEEIKLTNKVML
ncbi:MAG: EAL domain-containing protein [Woeseiaceae bacterium]